MKKQLRYIYFVISACLGLNLIAAQEAKHLVIISIDGFRPDFYLEDQWPTPNIKDLAINGIASQGVNGIFPTVTYPSHTTLITGVGPDEHGIYYNTKVSEEGTLGDWYYDFKSVKAKTLWEAAKNAGLKTASVSWPITVNAPFIDYNIPEIWSFDNPRDRRGATQIHAIPEGLFEDAIANATGNLDIDDYNLSSLSMDQNLSRIAGYIIRTYTPNLLTIHLPNTDGAQHRNGRDGIEVKKAIAGADQAVSTIIDALKKANILEQTNIIITGDHGFYTVHSSMAPNLWLKELGLLDKDTFFLSTGGSAFLHVKNKNDTKMIEKIVNKLESLPFSVKKAFRIISRDEMTSRGANPNAVLALSANDGFSFNNDREGELIKSAHGGKHGQYPDTKNIQTGFVASGPDFKKGILFSEIQMEDIAALAAYVLGTQLESSKGIVYKSMLNSNSRY
ncbi:alkaline phosphatase family protein [Winogradskyella pacifica]|uniref:alkaline phosphatase family protein n=1 Tax=Winogradskyella pacifica TaxID=664642 RepID=UPI0015CA7BDF|nr:ectonucleotide pyrophosphatase/phosphodiesterase [Winogradskyella pacifica]